ncbi:MULTISPECIES: glucose-1-phosphate cytidylyltransferase [unclassified Mycobacterium]|uniref:glucose-1-phosphate cytidylyltransferase n=1 Tax=unclassified Mycobacterium TaxID=2642494 RepID=UPI0007FF376D|nr:MULTISPECIES: glucose-1-phosphate cytidylyltransferase [unclassified Mycobacterium]OBH04733.1 glucose-1-phosphate cytidylyltransferase [Mycobacterium sp. E2699]OBH04737.1 glucose-1-phosphate cytidylyltransferase [Mycobacterium sp. E2699]OBI48174.1 glucose-1-phosphate cytidylyltransferase [Mycobacterium sp. E787]OBI48179.1 glucose-1-phosphate cytidylyltransferase [Mycobacterium sp. E787]
MKAVLLAGGLGTRMREETEFRPKPMVEVGGRPVLWHIMKILGHHGINDFIVCTGYKSEHIKSYFANYGVANLDFTITLGDQSSIRHHGSHDEFNWQVTVADTGLTTMTGGRIKRIHKYVGNETFLCTYGDGIADVNINALLEFHRNHGKLATVTATQPMSRFGVIDLHQDGVVATFREKPKTEDWINIGYFIFEPEIFDYLDGDDTVLEDQPLLRLAKDGQIAAYAHHGFWQPMDTYRESQALNNLWNTGNPPWKIWN